MRSQEHDAASPFDDWRARWDDLTGGLGWSPPAAVAVAFTAVALTGFGLGWWTGPAGAPPELPSIEAASAAAAGAPPDDTSPTPTAGAGPAEAVPGAATPIEAQTITVHAAGAVVAPGVYSLPAGARVADALSAAGGATTEAELDRVNLAAPLVDGARVWVPRRGEPAPATVPVEPPDLGGVGVEGALPSGSVGSGGPDPGAGPVSLSNATLEQLDSLPGVGPVTAAAIVEHRGAHGPFASVDELLEVRGIGEARLEQLRPLVVP